MSDRYPIPHPYPQIMHRTEQLIKRSHFITSTAHAPNIQEARAFIERIRQEFPDATHNCWAFAANAPGATAHVGFSDDGEPHGTAGRPMLTVLLHSGIGEIVSVVTRYFGGIKLGTGGLVRAYQGAVQENIKSLSTREKITPAYLDVMLAYSHIDSFRRLLPNYEGRICSEEFGTDAAFTIMLPHEYAADFTQALSELTDAEALVEPHLNLI